MESIRKLENTIEGWLKPLPHLPADWRKWLTENVWWITLIGVVISAFGILSLINMIFTAMNVSNSVNSWYNALGIKDVVYSNWWYASSLISVAFLALMTVLEAMAIKPLKATKVKGWDLMFLVFLLGIASQVVNLILNLGSINVVSNALGVVIGAAIGAYFLFEIRSGFKSQVKAKKAE